MSELPNHIASEISHFFEVYKQLEGKQTSIDEICGREEAERVIEDCRIRYQEKFKAN